MADQNQNPLLSTVSEDEQFMSPEGFSNATSAMDWDALLNCGNSNNKASMSKWERDSLYVKFDPLVASRNAADRASLIFKPPKHPVPPTVQQLPPPPPINLNNSGKGGVNINGSNNASFNDSYKTACQDLSMPLIEEDSNPRGFELGGGDQHGSLLIQGTNHATSSPDGGELISSDLSSDENKFLETIRHGSCGSAGIPGVEFGNDLLSEEELVNTIQNYGDVKVVQVQGATTTELVNEEEQEHHQQQQNVVVHSSDKQPLSVDNQQQQQENTEKVSHVCATATNGNESFSYSPSTTRRGDPECSLSLKFEQLKLSPRKSLAGQEGNYTPGSTGSTPSKCNEVENLDTLDATVIRATSPASTCGEVDHDASLNSEIEVDLKNNQSHHDNSQASFVDAVEDPMNSTFSRTGTPHGEPEHSIVKPSPIHPKSQLLDQTHNSPNSTMSLPPTYSTPPRTANVTFEKESATPPTSSKSLHQSLSLRKSEPLNSSLRTPDKALKPQTHRLSLTEPRDHSSPHAERLKRIAELKEHLNILTEKFETQKKRDRKRLNKLEMELYDEVSDYIKAEKRGKDYVEEKEEMKKERDEALQDLTKMESAFASMLMMYEDVKTCQNRVAQNCEILSQRETMLEEALRKREERNESAQQVLENTLQKIQQDFENKIKDREAENGKLKAKNRMVEMKISKLESEIGQVDRENEKLRNLCDDLLKK